MSIQSVFIALYPRCILRKYFKLNIEALKLNDKSLKISTKFQELTPKVKLKDKAIKMHYLIS